MSALPVRNRVPLSAQQEDSIIVIVDYETLSQERFDDSED